MTPEMTAELWAQVRSALETALALPASERAAFLEKLAAKDTLLQHEVAELLATEKEAARLFSIDQWHASAEQLASDGSPGMLVGHYRLLRELGRGGMGAVYLAERADGEYSHQVAVKLVQPSVLSRGMVERFRQERQILARLSHPGISRLLDGGVTDSGMLYAVMEYVEGEPIDLYCERHGLSLAERLTLFLHAAAAVQYAHQQLILHLDIKPANLLVNAKGEPRLLDFGISRIIVESESGAVQGEATVRMLTPRYASPEQAAGKPLGVASDVFSLGTLLYKLLTGRLPYPMEEATPLEAARMIQELPAQTPSRAAPPELHAQLRGDLDLILLKALRKEPERRYATVAAFMEDIERYLTSRPVSAHRDTLAYRASRFVRRHRGALAAASVLLLVLITCVGLVIRSAIVARREEALAQRRLKDVRDLAHSYIFELDPQLEGIPGTVAVRSYIVKTGMRYLDSMSKEAGSDDSLSDELARGYMRLSILENSFIYQSLGAAADARAAMDKAVELETAAYQRNPNDPDHIERYLDVAISAAMTLEADGDIKRYDETLQHLWTIGQPLLTAQHHPLGLLDMGRISGEMATNRIGNGALWNLGDPVGGLVWASRTLDIMDRVQREFPGDHVVRRAMVDSVYTLATEVDGYTEEREVDAVSAVLKRLQQRSSEAAFQQDPSLAPARRVANDYSFATLVMLHRLPEAELAAPQVRITETPEKENNSRLKIAAARALCMHALLDLEQGKAALGSAEMRRGLGILEDLVRADPKDINSTVQIVLYGTQLGMEPLAPEADRVRALHRVIELTNAYVTSHPEVAGAQNRLATAWLILDRIDRNRGQLRAAEEDAAHAREAMAKLRRAAPRQPQAELLQSQLDALATGALDHKQACVQQSGGIFFSLFLTGRQQVKLCASPDAANSGATPAPATGALTPSRGGR